MHMKPAPLDRKSYPWTHLDVTLPVSRMTDDFNARLGQYRIWEPMD